MIQIHDQKYDKYNTPDTIRADETTFGMPSTSEQHQLYEME